MRSRNIKPSFFKNETIGTLPYECRILFIGLWLMADKDGFLEYRPLRIKAEIFPYDNIDSGKITKLLEKLCNLEPRDRLIEIWIENGEQKFIQIINFKKHQSPHKNEMSYKIKELFDNHETSCNFTNFHGITGPFNERGMMNDEVMNNNTPLNPPKGKSIKIEKPDSVSDQTWEDFLGHRKSKKAPLTVTALKRIIVEVEKSGWKLEDALCESIARGWTGFKAEWVSKQTGDEDRWKNF